MATDVTPAGTVQFVAPAVRNATWAEMQLSCTFVTSAEATVPLAALTAQNCALG